MYQRHELGKKGERLAVYYLEKQGYKILEKNYKFKKCEIDIIAKEKENIVFIEVKTRSNCLYGRPSESVTIAKQKNIFKVAKFYLQLHKKEFSDIRIDVIEVYFYNNKYYIHHIKQIV